MTTDELIAAGFRHATWRDWGEHPLEVTQIANEQSPLVRGHHLRADGTMSWAWLIAPDEQTLRLYC